MTAGATVSVATRRSILLLSLATFSSMAAQRICDAMLPELSRVFAVSLPQAAQTDSVFAVVYGLSQMFYGPLGDWLGKFPIVTYATLWCSVGSVMAIFANSLDILLVARVMMALGAAAIIPLSMAWTGDAAPPDQLQETLARVGLGTTMGIVGGQLVGGVLTDTLGWRWAFGFMALLFGVVGLLLLRDWRGQKVESSKLDTSAVVRRAFLPQLLTILSDRWSRLVLFTGLIEGGASFGVLAIWASHLHAVQGLSLSMAGAIVALFGIGGMLYMVAARHLIRRHGQFGLVVMGIGLLVLSTLVVGFVPYWVASAAACLLGGFGFFMFHNVIQANVTQIAPSARGIAVSLFASSVFLGQSLGVLLAASLIEHLGSGVVIALGGATMLVLGTFFARALRRRQLKDAV